MSQHAVVLGATGRVGTAVVKFALEAGHRVTAVARNPAKIGVSHERLSVVRGDTLDPTAIRSVLAAIQDATAVVMAVGADPLRPSTVVTDTVRNLASAMVTNSPARYLGITGTAQMPATLLGRITQVATRRAIKAATDHHGAYDIITATDLDYTRWPLAPTSRTARTPADTSANLADSLADSRPSRPPMWLISSSMSAGHTVTTARPSAFGTDFSRFTIGPSRSGSTALMSTFRLHLAHGSRNHNRPSPPSGF